MSWCGILNVNKPPGLTSRDVVNRVTRLTRPEKAGHAGTLDPLATGVLVVCVGAATRLIEYVQAMPKTYQATFLLGRTSPSEDTESEAIELLNPPQPSLAEWEAATKNFLGEIQQRPPAYSALKVHGKRAYDLARAGETVELNPRPVQIHQFRVLRYEYPELELEIVCGSGTYIRSLGRDLAESLGTGAIMSALVRTRIGVFWLADAVSLPDLSEETFGRHLLPPLVALPDLPRMEVTESEAEDLANGRWLNRDLPHGAKEAAAVNRANGLVAIVIQRGAGRCGPLRNFPSSL